MKTSHLPQKGNIVAALASARGSGALAIFRISGENCFEKIAQCISERSRFDSARIGTIRIYTFVDPVSNRMIDEITAIKYAAPRSYTGEDMVEMFAHGGEVITDRIYEALLGADIDIAGPGEYTRRAFENGKMSVLKAEAIDMMIRSRGQETVDSALAVYKGSLDGFGQEIRSKLVDILSDLETDLEFSEVDDVSELKDNEWIRKTQEVAALLESEIKKRERVRSLDNGIKVVLAGEANVGKSTIFNALLENERSLVHHKAGTTRDYVSERVVLNGVHIDLIDTAGIRDAEEEVELLGIEKGKRKASEGHIIIVVAQGDTKIAQIEGLLAFNGERRVICLVNKSDIQSTEAIEQEIKNKGVEVVSVSMINQSDKTRAMEFVSRVVKDFYNQSDERSLLISKRQEICVGKLRGILVHLLENAHEGVEIRAQWIRDGLEQVDALIGIISSEEIHDVIFSKFCIGK